jgi:glycosyltransferase involved in cell wall biosynthesis
MNGKLTCAMKTNTKPRICFVGPMLGQHPGWVPNPAEGLANRLAARGFHTLLVSDKINRFQRLGDILSTLLRRKKEIDLVSIQVYSGTSFVLTDLASLLAKSLRIPIMMVLHGGELPVFFQRFPVWARRALGRAEVLITPSEFLAQTIKPLGFCAKVIPNAIQIANYPYRNRRNIKPNLLWMRTFHEIYNPLLAVNVLAQVKRSFPQASLTMAGQEKGLLQATRQHVMELNLDESVRFVGFLGLQDKQCEFASHDIFLNTNRVDNMPVSVVEAAAFGMPIVATAVGGLPYLIRDGETGLLITDDDAAAMSDAVLRLLLEPNLAGELSANARRKAESFDWSVVLPQWENIFLSLSQHKENGNT